MLYKEIPFLRITVPFCAGIISGLYFSPGKTLVSAVIIIITIVFILSLIFNRNLNNKVYGIFLTAVFILAGFLFYKNEKNRLSLIEPEKSIFSCTLSDYPEEKNGRMILRLLMHKRSSSEGVKKVRGSLLVYAENDQQVKSFMPGDQLIISCRPLPIANRGNPYEFDYRFFMENHGIKYSSFISHGDIISHKTPPHRKPAYSALIIRARIIEIYSKCGITEENLPLVSAITLGEKSKLDQEQKQSFMKAGIMHIMAVSGLHAVILSMFVFNLLFFMKKRFGTLRVIIVVLFIWFFAFVTGLTPSVLRASLMFTFLQTGKLMNRRVNGVNSILASAFFLMLVRPSVIFDAGFQLSYAAVLYIIIFYRELYMKLQRKNYIADKIWQAVVVTVVAQLGTLPLTIMLFNRFPVYFILTNILIVPLSSLVIITGCIIPIIYHIKFISFPLAFAMNHLTGLTELLTEKAASLPFSNIENIGMAIPECLLLYMVVFCSGILLLKKGSLSPVYPLVFIALLSIAGLIRKISLNFSDELIVYNTPGSTTTAIRTGKTLHVYSGIFPLRQEVLRHSAVLGLKIMSDTIDKDFRCISTGNHRIIICKSLNEMVNTAITPDIIILTGPSSGRENLSDPVNVPYDIIFASATRVSDRMFNTPPDTIHYIRKYGAYRKRL